jgi:uncharacterized protein YjbJ (UPF0337 family)
MLPGIPRSFIEGSLSVRVQEGYIMNKDIFEGKWKQLQGHVKEGWGKLTDDDLERVDGKFDQFVGLIQEKYGYTKQQAEKEIDERMTEYEARLKKIVDPAK